MKKLTNTHFEEWLRAYKRAWEDRIPEQAVALFEGDAEYYESPYSAPLIGADAIRDYWTHVPLYQENINVTFEVIAVKNMKGWAKWSAEYDQYTRGEHVRLDGVFEVKFSADGKCRVFQELWHREVSALHISRMF